MPATPPEATELLQSLGTALGLGLLVGLQREWVQNRVAGIRTFALLTLFGAISGFLGLVGGPWIIAAALLSVASLVVLANLALAHSKEPDSGLTTEMAILVMFAVGVITVVGERLVAVMIAGSVMVLLQSKKPLHAMVRRFGEDDLREIGRLVLAALVILPALPNREMGYLGVLNPFQIWLIVVLIIGISLLAYLAEKWLGGDKGAVVAGLLGGLISSTAVTASSARRSAQARQGALTLASMTLIASGVAFVRILVEVVIVAPGLMTQMLPPLVAMMFWTGLIAAVTHRFAEKHGKTPVDDHPPSELKNAVLLGLLYAVVLVVIAAMRQHHNAAGLFVAAFLSGLPDMSAITLSSSRLAATGHLDPGVAWRMILVGGMANLLFKAMFAIILGSRPFLKPTLFGFGASILGGALIVWLWP